MPFFPWLAIEFQCNKSTWCESVCKQFWKPELLYIARQWHSYEMENTSRLWKDVTSFQNVKKMTAEEKHTAILYLGTWFSFMSYQTSFFFHTDKIRLNFLKSLCRWENTACCQSHSSCICAAFWPSKLILHFFWLV